MCRPFVLAAAFSVATAACATPDEAPPPPTQVESAELLAPEPDAEIAPPAVDEAVSATVARATMESVDGSDASGTVTFTATDRGVLVSADLAGLPADGLRALHVRAAGSCADPGPLFNPDGAPLGSPLETRGGRPAGSLGNLRAGDDGDGRYEHVEPLISLAPPVDDPASVLGRALVVYAAQDDFHTLPDGAPGAAVACGLILPL
jgi:Cu-Zn family superoxide dismutase